MRKKNILRSSSWPLRKGKSHYFASETSSTMLSVPTSEPGWQNPAVLLLPAFVLGTARLLLEDVLTETQAFCRQILKLWQCQVSVPNRDSAVI